MPKKQGFATLTKAKHRELSALGGSRKVSKGYSKLNKEQATQNARKAAKLRWERVRMEQEMGKPINS